MEPLNLRIIANHNRLFCKFCEFIKPRYSMAKIFMGVRLRALRQERGLTQVALAQAMGLSPSYLNQLEQDQRPFTVPVLLKVHKALGVDIQQFSEDEEARRVALLRDAVAALPGSHAIPDAEFREMAHKLPKLSEALMTLHQRHQEDQQRLEVLVDRLQDRSAPAERGWYETPLRQMPFEAVRDFFFTQRNYFDALDRLAELWAQQASKSGLSTGEWLVTRLQERHLVKVQTGALNTGAVRMQHRVFDPMRRILHVSARLKPSQQAFQMATQLALLELTEPIDTALAKHTWQDAETQQLARIGLANYVAGALVLPYGEFLQAAERVQYDIDLLSLQFGVGFETVCHRLSTLQRAEAPGVPFFFIRVDRAGNISKRQSATHFHFSKTGGTCPLWNVYEAFAQPGRILPQLASMPDGRVYLWVARCISQEGAGWGRPEKTFSIGLGCDAQHAHRLVYSQGLDLRSLESATPIGMGCRVCERPACPQRAFPFVGQPLQVNENSSSLEPYA